MKTGNHLMDHLSCFMFNVLYIFSTSAAYHHGFIWDFVRRTICTELLNSGIHLSDDQAHSISPSQTVLSISGTFSLLTLSFISITTLPTLKESSCSIISNVCFLSPQPSSSVVLHLSTWKKSHLGLF